MSWTSPKTWVAGDVLTAADMNTYVRDNTSYLSGAPILLGQDTTERTTTATGTTTLSTISGLSGVDNMTLLVVVPFRKTSGGAYFATLTIQTGGGGSATHMASQVSDAVNHAGSGMVTCWIPPRYTNYVYSSQWQSQFSADGSTWTAYSGAGQSQRAAGMTQVLVTGQVSNSAITVGIQGVKVYGYA